MEEGKLKNYTKYDFAAIIGAEVSILLKSKVEYGGTLKIVSDKAIFLLMNDNPSALEGRWFAIEDIVPGSLSAAIKVEDMSVKQLKKAFNLGTYEVLVFNEATGTIANRDVDGGELGHTYEELPFSDTIDCTDWGWKHE